MERGTAAGPEGLTAEQRAAIERLRSSQAFTRAPRLKILLDFILDTWLSGNVEDLTEQIIGLRVFGRTSGAVGGENNIVRVSIRNLRARLEEYYASEGVGERWVIQIPKGTYVPSLLLRDEACSASPPPQTGVLAPASANGSAASRVFRRARDLPWRWAFVILAAAIALALIFRAGRDLQSAARNSIITQLFSPQGQVVNLVVVDSSLQYYRELLNRNPLLSDYAEHNLGRSEPDFPPQLKNYFQHARDTSLSSLLTAMQLSAALPGWRVRVRHPLDMTVRDFQQDHTVLLGGPWINPWGQMFEDRFTLQMVATQRAGSSLVRNTRPGPGEQADFVPFRDGVKEFQYARLALTGNLQGTGRVLLFGATSGSALEAAARYLTSPASAAELKTRLRRNTSALDHLELLLEIESYQGTPRGARLVLVRTANERH